MSIVSISGTLILNSNLTCDGNVTVEVPGQIIPIAHELTDTIFSCRIKDFVSENGKSPFVTSLFADINVLGTIDGVGYGFPANVGPGANSTLLDSFSNPIPIYGATHAGVGSVNLPNLPPPKAPYGSFEAPLSLGSGSGVAKGGSGIKLVAKSGTITVDGLIQMDGEDGLTSTSGGGSGGSVWLCAYTLAGSGLISSSGGDASYVYAGGGGGGYVTFSWESANNYAGEILVLGKKGAEDGVHFSQQIEPFFVEKFTGHIINAKWWDIVELPVVLNNEVQMISPVWDDRDPLIESQFKISGKVIVTDVAYTPTGLEPSYHSTYFKLVIDDANWVGVARRHNNMFGIYAIDGFTYQTAIPYDYNPALLRIQKSDSTFIFQFVDSSAGPQTIFSEVIPSFANQKFSARLGVDKDSADASHRVEYLSLTAADIANRYVTLSSVPDDASSVSLNIVGGTSQVYATEYYVDTTSQELRWDSTNLLLGGILEENDHLVIEYNTTITNNDLNVSWDNFTVYTGILHDYESKSSVVYVDANSGSDLNDGGQITPLQNLFVATAWAKRGGVVVLYDGTYNPTEILDKNITIAGAYGAYPLITTQYSLDTVGSNWENACLTFNNAQGIVNNVRLARAQQAISAIGTENLEVKNCVISDSLVGVSFTDYNDRPRILGNTFFNVNQAAVIEQAKDAYIYSNVVYNTNRAFSISDSSGFIISSNTIDRVPFGIQLDNTSAGVVVSNNITNANTGIQINSDSSVLIYNNNFFATAFQTAGTGTISDSSGNITGNPLYANPYLKDFHILPGSPNINAGSDQYDRYYLDRDGATRIAGTKYDLGAYEILDGTYGPGPYYVASNGDDYRNYGTQVSPFRTLDKAMSVADASVIMVAGHYDSYLLQLGNQPIKVDNTNLPVTIESHFSNIDLSKVVFVSPNGSDGTVFGGDGTDTGGNGTLQLPYRTIGRALQDASVGYYVVASSGDYPLYTGQDGRIVSQIWDFTGVPNGLMYLEDKFDTPETQFNNHAFSDSLWTITIQ